MIYPTTTQYHSNQEASYSFVTSNDCMLHISNEDKNFRTIRVAHENDNYRYFKVPILISEIDFLKELNIVNADNTVFENDNFILVRDISNFAPNCYVLYTKATAASFAEYPLCDWLMSSYILRILRRVLRKQFKVDITCIFYENYQSDKHSLAIRFISIDTNRLRELKIPFNDYQFQILGYLNSFSNGDLRNINLETSQLLSKHLNDPEYLKDYNRLESAIFVALNKHEKFVKSSIPNITENHGIFPHFAFEDPIDIYSESELPSLQDDMRYFVSIGGTKELQAFKAPKSWSRGAFMEKFSHKLDPVLTDLYNYGGLFIRQDASRALPGFYIIGPRCYSTCIDNINLNELIRCMYLAKIVSDFNHIRGDVRSANIYYDENYGKPVHIHFWSLPFINDKIEKFRMSMSYDDVVSWNYLETFSFQEMKGNIRKLNDTLLRYVNERDVKRVDTQLYWAISNFAEQHK